MAEGGPAPARRARTSTLLAEKVPTRDVHSGRAYAAILGIAGLVSAVFLPFSNVVNGPGTPITGKQSLFGNMIYLANNIGVLQRAHVYSLVWATYLFIFVTFAIFVADVLAVYPLFSGFLGIVGMAAATFAPYAIFSDYSFSSGSYGVGFWVLWLLPVLTLAIAFWVRRDEKRARTAPQPHAEVAPVPEQGAPAAPAAQ